MIERTLHEGVLTLRLAHGKASAIDVELLDALLRELNGIAEDVRALILTGTGSIFSAGVDLFRVTQEGADYVRRFLPLLSRFLRTLFAHAHRQEFRRAVRLVQVQPARQHGPPRAQEEALEEGVGPRHLRA